MWFFAALLAVLAIGALYVTVVATIAYVVAKKTAAIWVPIAVNGLASGKLNTDERIQKVPLIGWILRRVVNAFVNHRNWGFTALEEGQYKAIVVGQNGKGSFLFGIMLYRDHIIDQFEIVRHKDSIGKTGKRWDDVQEKEIEYVIQKRKEPEQTPGWVPEWIARHVPRNAHWIGNPLKHTVHEYNFQWATLRQTSRDGQLVEDIHFADRSAGSALGPLDYIIVNDDVYVANLDAVETQEGMPVDVRGLLTVRIVEPYKALFRVEQWLEATLNKVKPAIKQWVGNKPFEELIKQVENQRREDTSILTTTLIGNYIERHWGVRIKALSFFSINPSGDRGELYRAAITKAYEAGKEGEAFKLLAEAKADGLKKLAEAAEAHPSILAFRGADVLEKIAEKPSTTILPIGELGGMLQGLAGTLAGSKSKEVVSLRDKEDKK